MIEEFEEIREKPTASPWDAECLPPFPAGMWETDPWTRMAAREDQLRRALWVARKRQSMIGSLLRALRREVRRSAAAGLSGPEGRGEP